MELIFRMALVSVMMLLTACATTWSHSSGKHTLAASSVYRKNPQSYVYESDYKNDLQVAAIEKSRRVTYSIPEGWSWFVRGDDLILTCDGVFLEHIHIERIHISQTEQNIFGEFNSFAALSSKIWPTRTAQNLKSRFLANMHQDEAVHVLIESRSNDPAISSLVVKSIGSRSVAEHNAFMVEMEFDLKVNATYPRYRSVYYGFMDGEWFYGINYTAAERYYFDNHLKSFESFLGTVRLVKK